MDGNICIALLQQSPSVTLWDFRFSRRRAFWHIAPCSLVEVHDVLEVRTGSIIALMMDAVRTPETSVYFNETTSLYMPEGCHLHFDDIVTTITLDKMLRLVTLLHMIFGWVP
jgi:hypothetical protein